MFKVKKRAVKDYYVHNNRWDNMSDVEIGERRAEGPLIKNLISISNESHSYDEIVSAMVLLFIRQNNIVPSKDFLDAYSIIPKESLISQMEDTGVKITLKSIENYIESVVDDEDKGANGIVFTPNYIIKYILNNIKVENPDVKIIDPSCGCGSFLVLAAEYVANKFNKSIVETITNNLYGIDIKDSYVQSTKMILSLLCLLHNENPSEVKFNIICKDSIKVNWSDEFNLPGFDCIIGNPPYSNPHDLSNETAKYLRANYKTACKGTSNIFYAFVEKGVKQLSESGELGFIIPNNYLTITAAKPLRKYLKEANAVSMIIDFEDNMVFYPVRTYNSLLFLNNEKKDVLRYAVLEKTNDIEDTLFSKQFNSFDYSNLSDEGWLLLPDDKLKIIEKIETIGNPIRNFIHTGIATLRDNLYIIDGFDDKTEMYFKYYNSTKYLIEPNIVRMLYKISDISSESSIDNSYRKIICPYTSSIQMKFYGSKKKINKLISEETMKEKYPYCYAYFCDIRDDLNKRDGGKGVSPLWYAYGRTQGLNFIGKKLVFPTFSAKPKFMLLDDEDALFCNGYAFVEDGDVDLILLQKIINSEIMNYYVSNTSYSIEGGYHCYQKRFIQNFTIPEFTRDEIIIIKNGSKKEVDSLLIQKYGLDLVR